MGVPVYEQAPDAETLLLNDNAPAARRRRRRRSAEVALSTVDSEFGRTTDPVRMYMREMGTVELLTREGEIEIAKRIEDGLKHMVMAISACPTTIADILAMAERVANDEIRIDELVDGLIDANARRDGFSAGSGSDRERRGRRRGRAKTDDDDRHRRRRTCETSSKRRLAREVRRDQRMVRQDASCVREGRLQVEGVPEGAGNDPDRADDDPLHRAYRRASVRHAARAGGRSASGRASDPALGGRQVRHAAAEFIARFPEQRNEPRWIDREIARNHATARS